MIKTVLRFSFSVATAIQERNDSTPLSSYTCDHEYVLIYCQNARVRVCVLGYSGYSKDWKYHQKYLEVLRLEVLSPLIITFLTGAGVGGGTRDYWGKVAV